MLFWAFGNLNN